MAKKKESVMSKVKKAIKPKFTLTAEVGDVKFTSKGSNVDNLFADLGIDRVTANSTLTLTSGSKEASVNLNVQDLKRAVGNSTAADIIVDTLLNNLA